MASKVGRGEIIVCTDGTSNVGLGSMENKASEAKEFYTSMGKTAKANGTTISLIGIQGESVGVTILGKCVEATKGTVTLVNPLEVQRKMREIVDNPIVATDVAVRGVLRFC
jgi:hypothetical protein